MADFEIKNGVAVIPEGTTTIGCNAFRFAVHFRASLSPRV